MDAIGLITVLIEGYVNLIRKIFELRGRRPVNIGPLRVSLADHAESPYEETLERIGQTKAHLSDAISAIENIEGDIRTKTQELNALITSVQRTQQEKEELEVDYTLSQSVSESDAERLRSLLGIDELRHSRKDKVFGFIGGVVASLVAAGIGGLITFGVR